MSNLTRRRKAGRLQDGIDRYLPIRGHGECTVTKCWRESSAHRRAQTRMVQSVRVTVVASPLRRCQLFVKRGGSCSAMPVKAWSTHCRSVGRHKSIRQRLHEANNRIFLRVRKAEPPNSALVHVFGRVGRRPARCAFTDVTGLAAWKDVARVVEASTLAAPCGVAPQLLAKGTI